MKLKRVSINSFTDLLIEFYNKYSRSQRLGQFFWNRLGIETQSWPELFYQKDDSIAKEMIIQELFPEE